MIQRKTELMSIQENADLGNELAMVTADEYKPLNHADSAETLNWSQPEQQDGGKNRHQNDPDGVACVRAASFLLGDFQVR